MCAGRPTDAGDVHIPQHRVQITFQVLNGVQIRLGDGKLDEGIVNQVFRLFPIAIRQLKRPIEQPLVALNE
jgi:hypothetical protein